MRRAVGTALGAVLFILAVGILNLEYIELRC